MFLVLCKIVNLLTLIHLHARVTPTGKLWLLDNGILLIDYGLIIEYTRKSETIQYPKSRQVALYQKHLVT